MTGVPTTRVTVKLDGTVVVEGIGYAGRACLADLESLLAELRKLGVDARVEVQEEKPEAVEQPEVVEQ